MINDVKYWKLYLFLDIFPLKVLCYFSSKKINSKKTIKQQCQWRMRKDMSDLKLKWQRKQHPETTSEMFEKSKLTANFFLASKQKMIWCTSCHVKD